MISAEKIGNMSGKANFAEEKHIGHEKDIILIAVAADRRVVL